ncbi:MAG: DUF4177 domain-containing protein [Cyanobacteria bacterium P01_G01_bin.49]
MKFDLFTKTILFICCILLTILVTKPIFAATESHANKNIEYKVVALGGFDADTDQLEAKIQEMATDGWELVLMIPNNNPYSAVFKK